MLQRCISNQIVVGTDLGNLPQRNDSENPTPNSDNHTGLKPCCLGVYVLRLQLVIIYVGYGVESIDGDFDGCHSGGLCGGVLMEVVVAHSD